MASIIKVRQLYDDLLGAIEAFNDIWPKHVVSGAVYQLPIMKKVQHTLPSYIPVSKISGTEAMEEARSAFMQMKRISSDHEGHEQNPSSSFRLPGWIAVNRDLSNEIAELNRLKERLGVYLRTVSVQTRPDFNRKALPEVSILQLTRKIRIVSTPTPYRMRFIWICGGSLKTIIPREKAVSFMRRRKVFPEEGISAAKWELMIEEQIQQLMDAPPDLSVIRMRRHSPHPCVIAYQKRGSRSGETIPAALPTFVYCPIESGKDLPKIADLKEIDFSMKKRTPRNTKHPLLPLVPSLGLFTSSANIEGKKIDIPRITDQVIEQV